MNLTLPVISLEEFRKLLIKHIVHSWDRYSNEEIAESLLEDGFPKLDKEDLDKVMQAMMFRAYFVDPVVVDIDNREWFWLVSGNRAILVKKPKDSIETPC